MKILQLGKAYPPANLGGVEVVIQLLCEGLNKKGVYCDALGVNDKREFKKENGVNGGIVYRAKLIVKAFSTLLSLNIIYLLKKIRKEYDIIHIHAPDPMSALALLLVNPKAHIVLHWHSDILRQKLMLFFFSPIQRWLLNRVDIIIVTSPNYAAGSVALQRHAHKIKILPIGIDVDDHLHEEEGCNIRDRYTGKKIVFSLGRLAYYKGYEYLVKAAKYLPDNIVIIIAGEGNERKKIELLIAENKLDDKVQLLGKVSDKVKTNLFRQCDVFALSSIFKTEAYAIVQVEAMAYGKPIVSTRIPGSGVDWVNQNGETGITVSIRDERALAEAVIQILANDDHYKVLSAQARKRYEAYFTLSKMIDDVVFLYNQLLKKE
ncbi:rhamnosyl/mannosyltransferase [Filimonas lacunae]|uniref:Rhamnosyl/mannosyltransferase n=1 Tax=Filimonas lacunae TaxID=477680 RepID=A0A173MRR7_9BACT|nr:glycosyltransferase [Filimonas lacunae]BAV10206.1 glycosyltransferase [Filimonas lacunae]SIT18268.1 rhamnosyl/mannosyltransferase [Filimonas lacunae]